MAVLKNRAKMSTSTTGTGTITLGSVEDGYQTFADAGVANADVVRYVIEDGSNFEIGTGTYTSSGTTLSRTVSESSNSNNAINLSGSATVFIGATAEDIPALYADNASGATTPIASGTNAVALGSGGRASGTDTLAFNNNFSSYGASATGAIALGYKTRAQGSYSLAIGKNANSSGNGCISLGENSSATFNHGVAIGYGSYSLNNTHAVAIGYNSVSTGGGSYSLALMNSNSNGANSLAAQIVNNTTSYGAQGANSIAMGYQAKASVQGAVAIGYGALAENNTHAVAIGRSYADGADSFAAAIGNPHSSLGAKGDQSVAIGNGATASGGNHSLALGGNTVASGSYAAAIGGGNTGNEATNQGSFAFGRGAKSDIQGKFAFASDRFAANGDAQGGMYILRADTTDATATVLTTNNSSAGSNDQIVANADTCIMFSGTLVAMQNGAQDQGGWEIKGLLKNDGGTTTLVSSNIQTFDDGNGWTVALSADNTNNALAITCTGEAAHNIRWVANIQTSEVTYA
jgi:hypothetical protein